MNLNEMTLKYPYLHCTLLMQKNCKENFKLFLSLYTCPCHRALVLQVANV